MAMRAYSTFADWKNDQSPKHKRLIGSLQRLVGRLAPDLVTAVKWGQGCWLRDTVPKLYIHAEPDHLQFGFYAGATLDDPLRLLNGKGKYVRHVKIRTAADLDADYLSQLIRQVL
jgi:hypothetical protein